MRVDLKTLMEKLGVGRKLSAYETQPWLHYDENKSINCSAEVRVGPGMADIEAELQFLYDEPEKHEKTNPDQIFIMRILPVKDDEWQPKAMRVKGEDYVNKIGGWDKKGCSFFKACVGALQMGELPDIEDLIKKELTDDSFGGRGSGKIGRKSPKIKPAALMGMNKGGGGGGM